MRRGSLIVLTALTVVANGCEHSTQPGIMTNPPTQQLRLKTPDPAYRLTPAERSKVRPGFDATALERLMGMINPELRPRILRHFLILEASEIQPGERLGWLTQLFDPNTGEVDPQLQRVLEEVYAPLWDEVSDENLSNPNYTFYPGRERAMQRRAERRQEEPRQLDRRS